MALPNKNELALIAANVEAGLKAFTKKKNEFKAMKAEADKIKITAIDDKAAIKAAGILRKKLKAARCEVTRQSKELRQPLTNLAFMIAERERELIEIVQPSEQRLQSEEQWVKDEHARIEQEERERAAAIINARINRLAEYGYSVDTETLAGLDDETFLAVLEQARLQFEEDNKNAPVKSNDELFKQINALMEDERQKVDSDASRVMVDLNAQFASTINANPTLFEERKRLVMYAGEIANMIGHYSPKMVTQEGRDIIETANDALKQIYQMLMDSVEQI